MKFVYSPRYEVAIGPHVFPTQKYRLVRNQLESDGLLDASRILEPEEPPREVLEAVHTREYLDDLSALNWTHRTRPSELPLTKAIAEASRLACGGTILAAREAIHSEGRVCFHIGGGFHHAFADHAEGFCYLNDIAVAIRAMQREGLADRALIIDLDVHQGNGTAHIFEGDRDIFTVSVHQENNYPIKQRSDVDAGLDDGVNDDAYLAALAAILPDVMDRHAPDLFIYVAGADPYREDQLGGLALTIDGLLARDRAVLHSAAERGIATAVVLAGGYARNTADTVRIHAQTAHAALEAWNIGMGRR